MAISVTEVGRRTTMGDRRVRFYSLTFDSSFADEGESLTPATLGMNRIDILVAEAAFDMTGDLAYVPVYNYATEKLVMFNGGTTDAPLEEAGTDDLSAYQCRIMVVGV